MLDSLNLTEALAGLIGLYFVAAGIGVMRDRDAMLSMLDTLKTEVFLRYLSGVIAFFIGGAIVLAHNDWSTWLGSFVSLVGWIALSEGVLLLAVGKAFIDRVGGFITNDRQLTLFSGFTVAAGALLLIAALF